MFCDFGGVLGLYVGFSILTIFEFFELFASLMWICVVWQYRGSTRTSVSVAAVNDTTIPSDGNNQIKTPSARPPSYDGMTNNYQFQILNAPTKDLPSVNC